MLIKSKHIINPLIQNVMPYDRRAALTTDSRGGESSDIHNVKKSSKRSEYKDSFFFGRKLAYMTFRKKMYKN